MVARGLGDTGRRLRWQTQRQPDDQELKFGISVGMAREPDLTPVRCRQMNVDHLHGSELVECAARRQPGRQSVKSTGQRDLHAVSQKGDEDVALDPLLVLLEAPPNPQTTLSLPQ